MKPGKNKYHNKSCIVDGIRFASKSEALRYQELKLLKQAGKIKDFKLQPPFPLLEPYRKCPACNNIQDHIKGSQKNKDVYCHKCKTRTVVFEGIIYVADFLVIHNDGTEEVEDVKGSKGYTTPMFNTKRQFFERFYPDKTIKIVIMNTRKVKT